MLDSGTGHTALLLVTQLCCWSHSSVACSVVYRIATLLLLATGFFVGGARVKCVGELENNCKKCINYNKRQPKRFQMKSQWMQGCPSIQCLVKHSNQEGTLMYTGKQRMLGTSSQEDVLSIHCRDVWFANEAPCLCTFAYQYTRVPSCLSAL